MRSLLLRAGLASILTVAVLWEADGFFYAPNRAYVEAEVEGMCRAWSDVLPHVRDAGVDGLPRAKKDGPNTRSRSCGDGLRVRVVGRRYEAVLDAGGRERLLASTVFPAVQDPLGGRTYFWFAIGLATLVTFGVTAPVVRHADALETTARAIAEGDLDARADPGGPAHLGSLARSVNTMADRLSDQLRTRQVLLQAVAHELGQPLTRMRFALELLRDGPDARQLDRLDAGIDELDALSEAVARQLRLDARVRQAQLAPIPLAPLVRQTVPDDVETTLAEVSASVDADLFRIAVRNLVANARRHADTRVRVSLVAGALTVDDDGPGVPSELRARLLRPFAQGEGGGSLGLGLAMAADIARVHGGRLDIEDSPLGGARMVLRF
jgi:signal transduction histidine kinase